MQPFLLFSHGLSTTAHGLCLTILVFLPLVFEEGVLIIGSDRIIIKLSNSPCFYELSKFEDKGDIPTFNHHYDSGSGVPVNPNIEAACFTTESKYT